VAGAQPLGYSGTVSSPLHNVGSWIPRRAATTGARPALIDGDLRLTYADLEVRCARAAGWLAARGVGRGDRVALLLGNRAAYLELVFAIARLGAIAVPLNARLAPPEIAQLLGDCTPTVLCHEDDPEGRVEAVEAPPGMGRFSITEYEETSSAAEPRAQVAAVSPDDPMILMYTSGTTGIPKGALLPHRKALFNSLNAQLFFDLTGRDRVLVVVPLFHSFGLKILSIPALYAGACVVLQRHFDPREVWRTADAENLTILAGVPTMFRALLDALGDAAPQSVDLGTLRFMFTAGAAIPVEIIRAFEERGLLLKQGFGQTETSILCCLEADDAVRKAGSVGRPVFHCELRIVRADTAAGPVAQWKECAPGETGEIVVRGPITMLGYWNRPEATAETLREGAWIRTGDLASADDEGFITLTGRARDMYISGGENVYPAQVEATYHEHPAVRDIAVVGVPDERWGETGRAYVVLADGAELDPEALRSWGRDRLAAFKVPSGFVTVDSLPHTASGKVQKHLLPR
jgi:fatty-acyl-CoA synthase